MYAKFRGFPPGGFVNLMQQRHFAGFAPPHMPLGENSHLVGFTNTVNPPSPITSPASNGNKTPNVSIDIEDDDTDETSKSVKKRYWSHNEEVALVITYHISDHHFLIFLC